MPPPYLRRERMSRSEEINDAIKKWIAGSKGATEGTDTVEPQVSEEGEKE